MLSYIQRRREIPQAKSCIVAYRVTSDGTADDELGVASKPATEQSRFGESEASTYVTEGYDDSNQEGCGEKLLGLLQRMGVENIMIMVFIWHTRMPGHNSSEMYRNVIEAAKELLNTLH